MKEFSITKETKCDDHHQKKESSQSYWVDIAMKRYKHGKQESKSVKPDEVHHWGFV
jgi:hypothetical protein